MESAWRWARAGLLQQLLVLICGTPQDLVYALPQLFLLFTSEPLLPNELGNAVLGDVVLAQRILLDLLQLLLHRLEGSKEPCTLARASHSSSSHLFSAGVQKEVVESAEESAAQKQVGTLGEEME